ncbi:MAG: histone deacetylase, partial [Bacteroidota bacterium]
MHTAYTYDPTHVGHVHANHPEKPQRAHLAFNTLERDGILGTLACLDPVPNPEAAITRVHPQDYYDLLRETQKRAPFLFGFDTYVTPESFGIAERGVGALLSLTDAVADGAVDNGFALVRPPGHHARPFEAMGFCFFAN